MNEQLFNYGLYNSYVSRWLYERSIETGFKPDVTEWTDEGSGAKNRNSKSYLNNPWEVDWGIQYPTKTIYFDAFNISNEIFEGLNLEY